jgi:hypothetical protein
MDPKKTEESPKAPPLPPAIASLKRQRNEQNSFAWYQYMIVPETIRNINIYKLNKFPGFVPDDFNTFQDQLLALGVAKFIDERDPPESMSLSDIAVKFYAYFVGRMKTDRLLHLLTFSFLNERIPHDILKKFKFFEWKTNSSTIGMTGAKKQVQIKFTKFYKTTPFHISASLREVFVNSKNYWISGKRDRSLSGAKVKGKKSSSKKKNALGESPLLCELKFDKVINEAREMFVVSCIRAGVEKETIAKFCASQFLGRPIKSWNEILMPDRAASPKISTVALARDPSPKVVSRWDWTMDPRDYILRTWRFMAGVPSAGPDMVSLELFQKEILREYGADAIYYVKDFYNPSFVDGLVYDHPKMTELFGPYKGRAKHLLDYFSSENIYDVFKFMFSGDNSLPIASRAVTAEGFKVEARARVVFSPSKRYLALVIESITNVLEFENPQEFKIDVSKGISNSFANNVRAYVYESIRFMMGYPVDSVPDPTSLGVFINDLKQYKTDGEQAILYQVIDHHLPRDKSVVYESPRFEELFGPLARRHERLESALDINTIWNAGKQIFLGKAFMFKLKVNTIDSTRLCISIYFKRSTCGRYHGRVIELKKTERVDDAK